MTDILPEVLLFLSESSYDRNSVFSEINRLQLNPVSNYFPIRSPFEPLVEKKIFLN